MLTSAPALLISLAIATVQPVPAGTDEGPESIAALYFAPLESTEAPRVVKSSRLERSGPITLAQSIGKVEEALANCKALRLQMETLIGDDYGSYSVHPDWVEGYKSCLTVRYAEIQEIGDAIDRRQKALLNGQDAEAAVRASDAMARLSIYQGEVKKAIRLESEAQQDFVAYYNTGERQTNDE